MLARELRRFRGVRSAFRCTVKLLPVAVSCAGMLLLSACGGGSSGSTGSSASVTTYDANATAGTGGSISPASTTVSAGGTTQFTVTPSSGYAVSSVSGCGGTLSGDTYTTGTVNANCTVTASFVAQYTVTAAAGSDGKISPASATVSAGGTTQFTVTPGSGYAVSSVSGCGGTLSGNTYTTGTVNADCTVTASFSAAFTWVSGSSSVDAAGVYGTEGVAAAANVPGARDDGVTWTDASGNLWMFGGFGGYPGTSTIGGNFFNDLWKYSPSSGMWTWVGGSDTYNAAGSYGTEGVAAAANVPGARSNEVGWTDASGNFWLFGGYGPNSAGTYGFLNDLWEYSTASGMWTWVGGSDTLNATGVYGTEGVAAAGNVPGSRTASVSWTGPNGNLWLFGGAVYISGSIQPINDLWEYSPSSGMWTWVGGSSAPNAAGVYGTQGVAAATNMPGARYNAVSWTDANGDFWVFGGYGYDSKGSLGPLNDLWEYSPASGEWTWVAGSDTVDAVGVYGTQGVSAAANVPGARYTATAWTDASGHLWLFGGYGADSTGAQGYLNDLWEYSPSSGEWTWVGGSSSGGASGVYGTQGVTAASNVPGARANAVSWTGAGGTLWLLGGELTNSSGARVEMNDLWRYPTQ